MRSLVNAFIRSMLCGLFNLAYWGVRLRQAKRRSNLRAYWRAQRPGGAVRSYEELVPKLQQVYQEMDSTRRWAKTSGTRQEPKKIPFNRARLKSVQRHFMESMILLTGWSGHKTFFVLASTEDDQTLTAGLVGEKKSPGRVALLQAPYRYLYTPAGKSLLMLAGAMGARVALLAVTQPRYLYCTNPSTLAHFIDELTERWPSIRAGLGELLHHPKRLKEVLLLSDGPALRRLQQLAASEKAPSVSQLLPDLKAVITWDGGYVGPFLDRLRQQLPAHVQFLPMYSMSTEGIETLPHRIGGDLVFGPFVPDAVPEFLDENHNILLADELKAGDHYTLLMTDQWGLTRYDTGDVFEVTRLVRGWPDLRFKRRRNVTASLTGEKITEEQARLLQQKLKEEFPQLGPHFMTLYPVTTAHPFGYHLAIIGGPALPGLEQRAEAILREMNEEYEQKVASERLAPIRCVSMDIASLARLMGQDKRWESQFKILPLYERPIVHHS